MDRIAITHVPEQQRVDVTVDGEAFTSYIHPDSIHKPALFPLRTARGTIVTRGFPLEPRPGERVDHLHHVGFWFDYGDVNGVAFWGSTPAVPPAERGRYGIIRHRGVNRIAGGADRGELDVTMDWLRLDGQAVLREDTRFVFAGCDLRRTVDRITTLTAGAENVLFRDDKEGAFAIRVARELEHPSSSPEKFVGGDGKVTEVPQLDNQGVTGLYRSSEGLEGDDVWAKRANWVKLSGTIGAEPISLVMIDHPSNPGYPTYWHARGYGLFAANPFGQKIFSGGAEELNFQLPAGESVTFRHRVLIDSGRDLNDEAINRVFQEFSAT